MTHPGPAARVASAAGGPAVSATALGSFPFPPDPTGTPVPGDGPGCLGLRQGGRHGNITILGPGPHAGLTPRPSVTACTVRGRTRRAGPGPRSAAPAEP